MEILLDLNELVKSTANGLWSFGGVDSCLMLGDEWMEFDDLSSLNSRSEWLDGTGFLSKLVCDTTLLPGNGWNPFEFGDIKGLGL